MKYIIAAYIPQCTTGPKYSVPISTYFRHPRAVRPIATFKFELPIGHSHLAHCHPAEGLVEAYTVTSPSYIENKRVGFLGVLANITLGSVPA